MAEIINVSGDMGRIIHYRGWTRENRPFFIIYMYTRSSAHFQHTFLEMVYGISLKMTK